MASSRRPAALMRGPRWKPTWPALTGPSVSRWATSLRARTPGRWAWASASRPWRTRMRLAPVRGTTSQTVASATRSMSGLSGGSRRVSNQPRVRSERRSAMHEVEGDAGGAEGLGGVLAAGLVGIEDGGGGRQRGGDGVVVDDDHVHAELAGACDLGDAGDAAVERDEEAGALAGDALDGADVESVPLVDAVRDVGLAVERRRRRGRERGARWSRRRRRRSRRRG